MDRHSLERNAQIFLAPPNIITPAERQSAEKFFLEFRQTKSPYELCKELLETSTVDYVLFEASGLIGQALLREWSFLSKEHIIFMEEYLSHYVISHQTLAPFVKKRILQVIAMIVKRMTADDQGELCRVLLSQIEQLMMNSDLHGQLIGCGVMLALMQEFGVTSKSSSIGLRYVDHYEIRHIFESENMKKIFLLCITRLSDLTKDIITEEMLPLIRNLLSILESVLNWKFNHTYRKDNSIGHFTDRFRSEVEIVNLQLDRSWTHVIFTSELIQLFFSLYTKVRTNLSLAHYARSCLVQLAGLEGTVFANNDMKIPYITVFITEFINLVSNIEIIDQEAIDIATIIDKLIKISKPVIISLPEELFNSFIDHSIRLTRLFVMGEVQKELICDDENLYMQASNQMFLTWSKLLSDNNEYDLSTNKFEILALQIFDTFLKCKLSPPEGLRVISKQELESEVTEMEERDRKKYACRLEILGGIGRQILGHLLPLLAQFIEERTIKLQQEFAIANMTNNSNCNNHFEIPESIQNLYEDIHWLILLSGHVLCCCVNYVVSKCTSFNIPIKINDYLMDQRARGKVDINVTMQLLTSPQCNITDIPGAVESADHSVRIIAAVLRFSKVVTSVLDAGMMRILSPEVLGTTVWFIGRCPGNYMLLDKANFDNSEASVFDDFKKYREAAQWMINESLDYLKYIINAFKGEETLVNDCIELLSILLAIEDNALCVLKSGRLGYFVELATANEFSLPQSAKRGLMRAIVKAGLGLVVLSDRERYWRETLERFEKKFSEIVSRNDINSVCHDEYVKLQLMELLDYFIGMMEAVENDSMAYVFQLLFPVFNQIEKLLSLYQNYPEIMKLIFELLKDSTEDILRLKPNEKTRMSEIYFSTVNIYIQNNKNRFTTDWIDKEDAYEDTCFVLQLLNAITEFHEVNHLNGSSIAVIREVVLMPMRNMKILSMPSLCTEYYNLLILISCYIFEKGDHELFKQLMTAIELGFYAFSESIMNRCCSIVLDLARYNYKLVERGMKGSLPSLAPLINSLLNFGLSNSDAPDQIDNSLYYLISCYQNEYQSIIENFLAAQSDPQVQQKLAVSLNALTSGIQFNADFDNRRLWGAKYKDFTETARLLLTIK